MLSIEIAIKKYPFTIMKRIYYGEHWLKSRGGVGWVVYKNYSPPPTPQTRFTPLVENHCTILR